MLQTLKQCTLMFASKRWRGCWTSVLRNFLIALPTPPVASRQYAHGVCMHVTYLIFTITQNHLICIKMDIWIWTQAFKKTHKYSYAFYMAENLYYYNSQVFCFKYSFYSGVNTFKWEKNTEREPTQNLLFFTYIFRFLI